MNKRINVIITIILISLLLLSNVVFGISIDTSIYEPTSPEGYEEFTKIGSNYTGIIQYIGIILAVIILIILGIKYMVGSIEQKAEYKKTMMPYIIGCLFLVAAPALVRTISNSLSYSSATKLPSTSEYNFELVYGCEEGTKDGSEYIENNKSASTKDLVQKYFEVVKYAIQAYDAYCQYGTDQYSEESEYWKYFGFEIYIYLKTNEITKKEVYKTEKEKFL